MAGIVTKGRAIIPPGTRRSPGVREDARVLRQSTRPESQQTGKALETIQTAVDRIHDLLSAPPSAPDEFMVVDPDGNLLFWVGARVIDGKAYRGLATTEAYIGGVTAAADPSTAVIICDADGVRIDGATIRLLRNGILTELNNDYNGYPKPIGVIVKSVERSEPGDRKSEIACAPSSVIVSRAPTTSRDWMRPVGLRLTARMCLIAPM